MTGRWLFLRRATFVCFMIPAAALTAVATALAILFELCALALEALVDRLEDLEDWLSGGPFPTRRPGMIHGADRIPLGRGLGLTMRQAPKREACDICGGPLPAMAPANTRTCQKLACKQEAARRRAVRSKEKGPANAGIKKGRI